VTDPLTRARTSRDRLRSIAVAVGLGIAWLVLAVLIALGAAGLVTALDHVPGTAARQELTWVADERVRPALDAVTTDLRSLADDVASLGSTARLALTQVIAGDIDGLDASIAAGSAQLDAIEAGRDQVRTRLAEVPDIGPQAALEVNGDLIARYDALAAAVAPTDELRGPWLAFGQRAVDASRLITLLTLHDEQAAAAAARGSATHYPAALDMLTEAEATLADARALRDRLEPTTDVTILTRWLDRNADYDAALRALYEALRDSKGRVTTAVREAFAAEQAARERLPGDTRGLIVIMADVAQGGLNQSVIAIEEARGELEAALEAQPQGS
jgi:hypothetical protein